MYFYILNIEQVDESTVMLYGKHLTEIPEGLPIDAHACSSQSCRIRVENIYSPVFLKAASGKDQELKEDIKAFMGSKGIGYALEPSLKENVFYPNLDRKVDLIKVLPEKRVSFDDFFSDHSEAIVTEFSNPIENIIISRRLRGPCIVRIGEHLMSPREGVVVKSPGVISFVCNSSLPRLKLGTLAVRFNRAGILKYCLYVRGVLHCGEVRPEDGSRDVRAEGIKYALHRTPEMLVKYLNSLMGSEGIDCIVYHNLPSFILKRLEISGMVRCDLFAFASGNIKGCDFSLEELSSTLNLEVAEKLRRKQVQYENSFERLAVESEAIHRIFQATEALDLSKEMSEVSGYILNRALQNLRAERIEYTLLHELYARGYLFPCITGRKEVKYTGGLVLSPQAGFYEDLVLLLDFNSLYPSIIQEFNVCFSTVGMFNGRISGDMSAEQLEMLTEKSRIAERGFLPKVLEGFVGRRKAVKDLMKQSKGKEETRVLEIRQRALKLTANSIYGCLGFAGSRFCNYTMAAYITNKGRDLLLEAKRIAEGECGMRIIYGDTDSVMVHTGLRGEMSNYKKALEMSRKLREAINSRYVKIEIEVDKVFKKLLLYKKKKYAGLYVGEDGRSGIEYKGLDLVRKDFCEASRRICRVVLELLLTDPEDPEAYEVFYKDEPKKDLNDGNSKIREAVHDELRKLRSDLEGLPAKDFVIHNTLSKAPENYGPSATLPHVSLALRLKEAGMKFDQGDVVCYVIGRGSPGEAIHKRAYHLNEDFVIDYEYYISNQILPPLLRIVGIVKGFHAEKIGRIFGVERVVKAEVQKNISFLSPCCGSVQGAVLKCKECSRSIPRGFYTHEVNKMIRREIECLYSADSRCHECGISSYTHMKRCFNCNSELSFVPHNQDFDCLLSSLQAMFAGWGEVEGIIRRHLAVSEYRRIELSKYFEKEMNRKH
ncbi:DNA polymerase type-B alpha subfamily catalytic domain-containing protein [Encephalitozoon hellem ATCC 50504]|uniref:DNA polymerase n=1 Tax=Encephalitozoon hellem TaxID=27973 RepID=A0A9Q9C620_ENCHE|nr:DNA polymerase type-B alpha subfamily catalytic domain-containing protein [Encephalitozoon hellem ATCC 50504]AFM98318.1 DNA polymerase type-B alpha subfamily catalytic domain-containing protein [Encephalitozoon hellem ATCC 50504]UTX43197.1 DNA polymerase alpha catalytic subunit [Encephalitozoon hellem]|eukprot:XP_003887299.1 DNA polymerase type-B alpha subfamily catalytic domain-containing protein [Encephalitozoon hellem ATCC 50504]